MFEKRSPELTPPPDQPPPLRSRNSPQPQQDQTKTLYTPQPQTKDVPIPHNLLPHPHPGSSHMCQNTVTLSKLPHIVWSVIMFSSVQISSQCCAQVVVFDASVPSLMRVPSRVVWCIYVPPCFGVDVKLLDYV